MVGIQSPIPLIYLDSLSDWLDLSWDSVTYPLDILVANPPQVLHGLGFSHLSP